DTHTYTTLSKLHTSRHIQDSNYIQYSYTVLFDYFQIWDLADPERKGFLDKRGFFVALRLVASAQGGNDISLNNLNQTLAAPKFRDINTPSLSTSLSTSSSDSHWAVRSDEKRKFDGIFESLLPVNGLLSGDQVKPVLINSKLPLDVLGRVST
uniref:EH domain-containing protein n=1 Tax=Hucho hucho TaxID=62062 RepID=A0A4W5QL15_9TELE